MLLTQHLEGVDEFDSGNGVYYVRESVAQALGTIGDPAAINPLERALANSQPRAATAIEQALKSLKSGAPRKLSGSR